MTDEITLIKDVLDGNTDSFRFLVQRYQGPVISMIKNIINDHHICEDVAQDVFFTAYKKLSSFDHARSNFSTWLFTIAKNKSINVLRKKKPRSMTDLPEKIDPSNPSDNLEHKEFFDKLDQALQSLPARQKTAFVLAEFQKLTYEEIAQIEATKIGTIRSRIHRAKKKLKSALKNYAGDKP